MSKITAVLGSALFFVVAPAMVAGLIPWLITHWEFRPPFLAVEATRLAGVAFIIAGVPGLLDSFARFALEGLGTPAPIAPPIPSRDAPSTRSDRDPHPSAGTATAPATRSNLPQSDAAAKSP